MPNRWVARLGAVVAGVGLLMLPGLARAQYVDGLPKATVALPTDLGMVCQGGSAGVPGTCIPHQIPLSTLLIAAGTPCYLTTGCTLLGNLQVGATGGGTATFYPGTASGLAIFNRPHSLTSDNPLVQSNYIFDHLGGTGGHNLNNTVVRTTSSGAKNDGLWNFYSALSTTTAVPTVIGNTNTQIGTYLQATRIAITDPTNTRGVPLEAAVIDYHDLVDQPTSVKGLGTALEVDFTGNGLDDFNLENGINLVLAKANTTGSDLIMGNALALSGSTHSYFKRGINFGASPFVEAGIDMHNSVQLSGAHSIWLNSGEHISWAADGSHTLEWNPGNSHFEYAADGTHPVFSLTDAGDISGSGNATFSTGTGSFAALTVYGHVAGTAQTLGVSSCGTSPVISAGSNDFRGRVVTGTGAPTACTVTFATAYASAPFCTATTGSATASAFITSTSTTQLVLGFTAGLTSGNVTYTCIQ